MNNKEFYLACSRVLAGEKLSDGFTVYNEQFIHKAVKLYLDPDPSHHECPLLGGVADVFSDGRAYEVQTGSFAPLLPKLRRLLPEYRVTLVHPLISLTHHRWLDRASGEISERPKRRGRARTLHSLGFELYKIRELIGNPNFSLRVIYLECDEFRALDGWDKTKKRGATLLGRIPIEVIDEQVYASAEDYKCLLPETLPDSFFAKDYLRGIKSRSRYDTYALRLLCELGFVKREKQGRAYVYSIEDPVQ
jgi:hypothetical protein